MNVSIKSVEIFKCIVELRNNRIHGLFQCEVRYRLDASRLIHNELYSLDLSMNI